MNDNSLEYSMKYLVIFFLFFSCATKEVPVLDEEKFLKKIDERLVSQRMDLYRELRESFRGIVREEIMPQIKDFSSLPPKVREGQERAQSSAKEKMIVGRIEKVQIDGTEMKVKARIDSGAQTSSIHAENVVEKIIEGEKYVQFETLDDQDKRHAFLKKVIASTVVRSSTGEANSRYVIRMTITLAGREHEINVNLNDRTGLVYRFLVGRNLLMGNYVVDVSQSRLLGR